eukprot:COSAG05_NODE_794_length_7287_cov_45.558431_6_plen_59_part_00
MIPCILVEHIVPESSLPGPFAKRDPFSSVAADYFGVSASTAELEAIAGPGGADPHCYM